MFFLASPFIILLTLGFLNLSEREKRSVEACRHSVTATAYKNPVRIKLLQECNILKAVFFSLGTKGTGWEYK